MASSRSRSRSRSPVSRSRFPSLRNFLDPEPERRPVSEQEFRMFLCILMFVMQNRAARSDSPRSRHAFLNLADIVFEFLDRPPQGSTWLDMLLFVNRRLEEFEYAEWLNFPINPATKEHIEELQRQDTRKSKRQAHQLLNGAWKVYLHKECGNKQLAIHFLRSPTVMVDTLLMDWAQYMRSAEYQEEKQRSRRVDSLSPEERLVKDRQVTVKLRVNFLRNMARRMRAIARKSENPVVPPSLHHHYARWRSGALDLELINLLEQHPVHRAT